MKTKLWITLAVIGLGVSAANAGVAFGISFGSAPRYCAPPPVVYQPCAPPPVVYRSYEPRVVVVERPVVVSRSYCAPRYVAPCRDNVIYFGGRHGGGHRNYHRDSGFHGSVTYRW